MVNKYPAYILDAFTGTRFCGSQAAVCLIKEKLSDEVYQKIGAEFNLAATAFPIPLDTDDFRTAKRFGLRWFTPKLEVPLCGHATLATSHVILNEIGNANSSITFETHSGDLIVRKASDPAGHLTMNFPQFELTPLALGEWPDNYHLSNFGQLTTPPDFVNDLIEVIACGRKVVAVAYPPSNKSRNVVVAVEEMTRKEFEGLAPPVEQLMKIHPSGDYIKGIILTVKASAEKGFVDSAGHPYDFASRYFAPWYGIKEDPATGSAHSVLGPFWERVLNKKELKAVQCYPTRGAEFHLKQLENDRVDMTGQAIVVIRGEIDI
uniref:Uncharacterized protein n=1 Tax=Plectus sambesii TaxID=2011161 RepID=A0A914WJ32_9BILA